MNYDLSKLTPDTRRINDMREVLADKNFAQNSNNDALYYMYRGLEKNGELRYDQTIVLARILGNEFNKTKGHYHAGAYQEVYMVLEGRAIYLMQKKNTGGQIEDAYFVEVKAGEAVIIPPFYGHVTINPSKTQDLKMANWISENCKSDYSDFVKLQGACYYYTLLSSGQAGWIKNGNYKSTPLLRQEQPIKSVPKNLDFLKVK